LPKKSQISALLITNTAQKNPPDGLGLDRTFKRALNKSQGVFGG
jgi:hypothetical protein